MDAVLDRAPAGAVRPRAVRPRAARPHADRALPLRIGTRASPLALVQTRLFLERVSRACPVFGVLKAFEEHPMSTAGDRVQDRPLAGIGGKGLFAKEIHEALLDGRIDFAVHSLKDLETELPRGVALACLMPREDSRDAMVLGPACHGEDAGADPADPWARLPRGALVGSASVRRQAQILHMRPDLRVEVIRGNVQTRIGKERGGAVCASFLALAGLRRLGLEAEAGLVIDPDIMVPAAGQGIVGITCREEDTELLELLHGIEHSDARAVATAERALLGSLDGSCRTPIGAHARLLPDGTLRLTGLVARPDGSFLLKRSIGGGARDAGRLGRELGAGLRRDSPADILV
jgi:hydroxymethylbilane synthase